MGVNEIVTWSQLGWRPWRWERYPRGWGPRRWDRYPQGWGPRRWNAGTFTRLGGESWDLLLKGAKVGKTPFASLAGWAKDRTGNSSLDLGT